MLADGKPKPCKSDPMRNGTEIFKDISGFIQYWKEMCKEDITRRVQNTHEPLIVYRDRICSALKTFDVNIRSCLTQGFWPQSRITIVKSKAMFFNNGDVREEFAADDHYVGLAHNRPAPSFCVVVDCYKGYMKMRSILNWFDWWNYCHHQISFQLVPIFVKLRWNIAVQTPKIKICSTQM